MTAKTSHLLSITATLVLIATMIALYRLNALFSENPLVIGLQISALGLMAWARWSFGRRSFHFAAQPTSATLITKGIYKYIRHPIYTAIWLFSWAGVSAHLSLINSVLAFTVLATLLVRIACEEFCLREQFSDYPAYAERTARFIPFLF